MLPTWNGHTLMTSAIKKLYYSRTRPQKSPPSPSLTITSFTPKRGWPLFPTTTPFLEFFWHGISLYYILCPWGHKNDSALLSFTVVDGSHGAMLCFDGALILVLQTLIRSWARTLLYPLISRPLWTLHGHVVSLASPSKLSLEDTSFFPWDTTWCLKHLHSCHGQST